MKLDMTVANQLATGAPGTVTIGETVLLVGQPTDADFVTMRRKFIDVWKSRNATPLKDIAAAVKDLPPNIAEMAIKEAVKLQSGNQEPSDDALKNMLYEPANCAFWLWLLARKCDATLTLNTVLGLITEDNVNDVLVDLLKATRLKDVLPNSDGANG